tara:strand:+ start:450 stop:1013 length:564 start_codon:yes stop_codon:yes gene_type:complete
MQEVDVYYIEEKYPVFTTFLNHSSEEIRNIKETIIEYRKENPKSNKSNVKAWHSHYKTHNLTNCFENINLRILYECDNILNSFNNTNDRLLLHDMWVNMYEKGDYTDNHAHIGVKYSCCYYIDIEENCSPIKFQPKLEIKPENDMLVLFGANVYHEVPPTNGKRTLIAMNLDYPSLPLNLPTVIKYS